MVYYVDIDETIILSVDVVKSSIAIKNLIENAFKYSPRGSNIYVQAQKTLDEYIISVVDSGPGIPKEHIEKITKAFVRIPGSKESGFGLGLSICHKVMVAHGGFLKIKNMEKGGACFSLHYPINK